MAFERAGFPEPPKTPAIADILRLDKRAWELEQNNARPAIVYWARMQIANELIKRGLEKKDAEWQAYGETLMKWLEGAYQSASEPGVKDEGIAQTAVRAVADRTLEAADNSMSTDTVTVRTLDTLNDARVFYNLFDLWPSAKSPDVNARLKYIKFHIVRIQKAIKAGEDPNLTHSPKPKEPEPSEETLPDLDPNDPEVQDIQNGSYQPPSVQSAPPSPAISDRISPPAQPPRPTVQSSVLHTPHHHDVSPLSPPGDMGGRKDSSASQISSGGGYFPRVPTFSGEANAPSLPTAPPPGSVDEPMPTVGDLQPSPYNSRAPNIHEAATDPLNSSTYYTQPQGALGQPSFPSPQAFSPSPQQPITSQPPTHQSFSPQPPQHQAPSHAFHQSLPQQSPRQPTPQTAFTPQPPQHNPPPHAFQSQTPQPPPSQSYSYHQPPSQAISQHPPIQDTNMMGPFRKDEDSIAKAQKHAKWAMSALNFDDVDTAVNMLREALADLGAR